LLLFLFFQLDESFKLIGCFLQFLSCANNRKELWL